MFDSIPFAVVLNDKYQLGNPATCDVQSEIWFLKAKNVCPVEIHSLTGEVQGEGAVDAGNVSKWC